MRVKQLLILVLLALTAAGAAFGDNQLTANGDPVVTAVVEQLSQNEAGVKFTLRTPPGQYADGRIAVSGLESRLERPGEPALPIYTTFIALPPTGEARVTVNATAVSQRSLRNQIIDPVAEPQLRYNPLYADEYGLPDDAPLSRHPDDLFVMQLKPDETIYGADAFYPAVYYRLSEPMMLRDVRLAQLTLYPVQYNPARNLLLQAERLEVSVTFSGVTPQVNQPSPTPQDQHISQLQDMVLNFDQIEGWRSLPATLTAEPTRLPIGQDVYKIEVGEDGVYELTYEALAAAGMDVANVNPLTFEMLHRGETVAYEFVGNPHDGFQPGESVRFYGWVGLGSRLEDQFVRNNVFWLWPNGQPTTIGSRPSQAGHPLADHFPESLTFEDNNFFFHTWSNLWDLFPNEPDVWFWERLYNEHPHSPHYTYPITLPHPSPTGPAATLTVEFYSRTNQYVNGAYVPHEMEIYLNDHPEYTGSDSWMGIGIYLMRSVNVTATMPMTAVHPGPNTVQVIMTTDPIPPQGNSVYVNRITVDYARQFAAVNDALTFAEPSGGGWAFAITDFTAPPDVVWDITNRLQPVSVSGAAVTGGGPYTLSFGSDHPADSRFIVSGQPLTPVTISQYTPPDLTPPGGAADWLAVSHGDFITATNQLAAHRADPLHGGLATYVVDIADVVNQYGYGLHTPQAINNYLRLALAEWERAPAYLVLVGDATDNPRPETLCPPGIIIVKTNDCRSPWNPNEVQFIASDLVFEDRWNGMIPSDFTMSLLVGDDLAPDIAIGRLTAQTEAQAQAIVDKIILYEENLLSPANYDNWLENILFVSDRSDTSGGNFCALSAQTGGNVAATLSQEHLCAPNAPTAAQLDALRGEMVSRINAGISILNYRGHGSVVHWGGRILRTTAAYVAEWQNADNPIVTLSVDCLDGYFAWPGNPGIGETYHKVASKGSAAHWSATGLGITTEHSILHNNFYRGLFDQGQTAIGDAIKYAKLQYLLSGAHRSQLYSFTLQGDPAMQLMRPDLHLEQEFLTGGTILPGDEVQVALQIRNEGLYPALTAVVSDLPPALSFVSVESDLAATAVVADQQLSIALNYGSAHPNRGLPYGLTTTLTITLQVDPAFGGGPVSLTMTADTPGLPITPNVNSGTSNFTVYSPTALLSAFTATTVAAGVQLNWTTEAEFNAAGLPGLAQPQRRRPLRLFKRHWGCSGRWQRRGWSRL
jgi:hypothetical protein